VPPPAPGASFALAAAPHSDATRWQEPKIYVLRVKRGPPRPIRD